MPKVFACARRSPMVQHADLPEINCRLTYINQVVRSCLPLVASTAITRARTSGSNCVSNHGLRLSQPLLRGLGWGRTTAAGQWRCQFCTAWVTPERSSGICQASAY